VSGESMDGPAVPAGTLQHLLCQDDHPRISSLPPLFGTVQIGSARVYGRNLTDLDGWADRAPRIPAERNGFLQI